MKEELTTDMHYEFLEDMGVDKKDYYIFAVSGAIERGVSKEEALKKYGISEEEYDSNIDRVLHGDSLNFKTEFEKAEELAKAKAEELGYDITRYRGEYKGGYLFHHIKSSLLHKKAGFPLHILVKDSKAECLDADECFELYRYGSVYGLEL